MYGPRKLQSSVLGVSEKEFGDLSYLSILKMAFEKLKILY
jgi:hypothetical protein